MRTLLAILFVMVCNTTIFSQTKLETKDWILETYNSFKRTENKNDFLIIKNDSLILHGYFYKYKYNKVAFKDIISIQIRKRRVENIEWYQIDLKTKEKVEVGTYENNSYTKDYSDGPEFTILLNPQFNLENYPNRMQKALMRIITLCGGKAILLKEAF